MQPQPSTETHQRKIPSGEAFSFPSTPTDESDFEFGCITPDSPSSKNSPADHLFHNGKLLPHSFPFQPPKANAINNINFHVMDNISRTTSRTSSIRSKDSLMSSRSNSTNSRSSSCSSSARTSSSDSYSADQRKQLYQRQFKGGASAQVYGASQRWQFIAPVPALSRETSRRRKLNQQSCIIPAGKKEGGQRKPVVKRRRRFGWRLFRWFVSTCKKCHAMEPSKKDHKVPKQRN